MYLFVFNNLIIWKLIIIKTVVNENSTLLIPRNTKKTTSFNKKKSQPCRLCNRKKKWCFENEKWCNILRHRQIYYREKERIQNKINKRRIRIFKKEVNFRAVEKRIDLIWKRGKKWKIAKIERFNKKGQKLSNRKKRRNWINE